MAFVLPQLPYALDALEPYMSANTLNYHYGKHHRGYVDVLNKLIAGSPLEKKSLIEIVCATAGDEDENQTKIFNNAAQVWNHTLFWRSMRPGGGGEPHGTLKEQIVAAFGSYKEFKEVFTKAGMNQFGSGYAWLVASGKVVAIHHTPNAYPPFVDGNVPLLCCDVWEHAYYLDYQNRRQDFLTTFLDHLVDWDAASARMQEKENAVVALDV